MNLIHLLHFLFFQCNLIIVLGLSTPENENESMMQYAETLTKSGEASRGFLPLSLNYWLFQRDIGIIYIIYFVLKYIFSSIKDFMSLK